MGLRRLFLILPFVAHFGQAQTPNATATDTAGEDAGSGKAPSYTIEECDDWLSAIISADADSSKGLSEPEYYDFLSSIKEPPYVAAYFETFTGYDELPFVFRIVHKTLACHCQNLGYGEECCEGDDAEIVTPLLENNTVFSTREASDGYRDLICQQIAYVLSNSIRSPSPTASPSEGPTASPAGTPTSSPVTESPTVAPTVGKAQVIPVTGSPTGSPSASPSEGEALVAESRTESENAAEEEGGGIGTGGIVGIIIAIIALILATMAFVRYRRIKEEEQLRKFAGEQAPEADLEAPLAVAPPQPEKPPEPEPAPEPEGDDESSASSVWSEGDEDNDTSLIDLQDDNEPVGETAGSALAAMGAASTVAANLMSSDGKG
ncbi:hypothetical protein ACHAWF_004190 [Thalassiosira exigua]